MIDMVLTILLVCKYPHPYRCLYHHKIGAVGWVLGLTQRASVSLVGGNPDAQIITNTVNSCLYLLASTQAYTHTVGSIYSRCGYQSYLGGCGYCCSRIYTMEDDSCVEDG